jgi:ribosomal protein L40E
MCSGSGTLGFAESDDLEFSSTACMDDISRDVWRSALVNQCRGRGCGMQGLRLKAKDVSHFDGVRKYFDNRIIARIGW